MPAIEQGITLMVKVYNMYALELGKTRFLR